MGVNKKTVKELRELLKKIDEFKKDLPRLRNTLSRHVGQAERNPSGW